MPGKPWGVVAPNTSATQNFTYRELACRHCGRLKSFDTALSLAKWLEEIRAKFGGKVIHINSAHRCPEHNAAIKGAIDSFHPKGQAADITIRGLSPEEVWYQCKGYQRDGLIGGVGHYPSFTHIDTGPTRSWDGS